MKRYNVWVIFSTIFLILMFSPSYTPNVQSKEMKPAAPVTPSPKVHDLEAKMPVSTRKPISGGVGVFIVRGTVCNIGTIDHASPPHEPAYVELAVIQPGHPKDKRTVLASQKVTNLKKGECINLDATYKVSEVIRYYDSSGSRVDPGECKEEVSFWITIGRDPKTSGRTYTYDYPDANTGNNIAGQKMEYLVRCPR